jgi:C4-dicarboxylate-specific signal transduction histidine kinase
MAHGDGEPCLGREGVLFFGGVSAGLSHELSNVLNIINELAGLQHDISAAAAEGGDARIARIADLADRIKAQISRGEEINRRLHRFAHSVDNAEATFDLRELLALLAYLEARQARLSEVELTVRAPDSELQLRGDPFALLLAVHGCVTAAVRAAGSGGSVSVDAIRQDAGATIRVSCSAPMPAEVAEPSTASALFTGTALWGATVSVDPPLDAPHSIVLTVPAVATGASPRRGEPPPEEET